jgi:MFS family permease
LITGRFVREGPYRSASPRFDRRQIGLTLRDRGFMLANLGYLGHMWELYAMWTWIAAFLSASFALSGIDPHWASFAASLATFSVIGVGCLSSIVAGILADRVGRTTITIVSLAVSGTCAFFIGQFFGGNPLLLTLIALVWGFAVVADSAQFSACISELADKQFIGTALTLQTSMGFLLTLVTIRAVPLLRAMLGWQWVFAFLAIGPVFGMIAMFILRRSPISARLANGRR